MLVPLSKTLLEEHLRTRAIDTVLSSLGISAAVVSASFAGYMAVVGPNGAAMPMADRAPLAAAPTPPRPAVTATVDPNGIDFTPTGTVPDWSEDLAHEGEEPRKDPNALLPDFAVRDVFDGTALVEVHGTLQIVKPGSFIDGAGEVLSIARRGRVWLVKTAGGVIAQRR